MRKKNVEDKQIWSTLFVDDILVYVENPKESTKKSHRIIRQVQQVHRIQRWGSDIIKIKE